MPHLLTLDPRPLVMESGEEVLCPVCGGDLFRKITTSPARFECVECEKFTIAGDAGPYSKRWQDQEWLTKDRRIVRLEDMTLRHALNLSKWLKELEDRPICPSYTPPPDAIGGVLGEMALETLMEHDADRDQEVEEAYEERQRFIDYWRPYIQQAIAAKTPAPGRAADDDDRPF